MEKINKRRREVSDLLNDARLQPGKVNSTILMGNYREKMPIEPQLGSYCQNPRFNPNEPRVPQQQQKALFTRRNQKQSN